MKTSKAVLLLLVNLGEWSGTVFNVMDALNQRSQLCALNIELGFEMMLPP